MADWLDTLTVLRRAGTPAIAVTVASTSGSSPREPGTKMIVTAADLHGTIGGGHVEHEAIAIARDRLARGDLGGAVLRDFPVSATHGEAIAGTVTLHFEPVEGGADWLNALAAARDAGEDAVAVTMAGGETAKSKVVVTRHAVHGSLGDLDVEAIALARGMLDANDAARLVGCDRPGAAGIALFLEPVHATDLRIVLFGAGHVGRALVRALADVPCRIRWVDSREGEFPRDVPSNVTVACTDAPDEEVDTAPRDAYFLVMTHSHALDEALAERILRRGDYAYFGLIGSAAKRRAFEGAIAARGVPSERLGTMTCPIGVDGIRGKEPAVIAIAVAAQLLQVRARARAADRSARTDTA